MFSDTGDHSIKVINSVTGKCNPYLAHGKGTRDGKSAQFVQPARLVAERRVVLIVDCSKGCLRMVSDVFLWLNALKIQLREFTFTFGLHLKKLTPVALSLDRAITRIQEVYDFDCQFIEQVKVFL